MSSQLSAAPVNDIDQQMVLAAYKRMANWLINDHDPHQKQLLLEQYEAIDEALSGEYTSPQVGGLKHLVAPVDDPVGRAITSKTAPRVIYVKLSPGMIQRILNLSHLVRLNGASKIELHCHEPIWSYLNNHEACVSTEFADACIRQIIRNGNRVQSSVLVVTPTQFYWRSVDKDPEIDGLMSKVFPVDVLLSKNELHVI